VYYPLNAKTKSQVAVRVGELAIKHECTTVQFSI